MAKFNENAKLAKEVALKDMSISNLRPNTMLTWEKEMGIKFSMVKFHREVAKAYAR